MHPYSEALYAMQELLDALGLDYGVKWIEQDLHEWESGEGVQHHLSAYGGMGSFNDIGIGDVWAEALLRELRSVCYYFAHHLTDKRDTVALEQSMGSYWAQLWGIRCLACGCSVTPQYRLLYCQSSR